jgi:glucosamine-6-phosphate deaminase
VVGTGNSQGGFIEALVARRDIDWSRLEIFHLDEYVGISPEHPASFRNWLKKYVADRCRPGVVHYIAGDALDLEVEMTRYADLLNSAPIDVGFVGFGENGHIAFNDPAEADFADPLTMKVVTLDSVCRQQQVGEGHFPDIASVPQRAVTMTCSALLRARAWVCMVPDRRKAEAVRNALEGPISTQCPASIVREYPAGFVFLDQVSSSLLRPQSYISVGT